ncbi:hypothetical protein VFSR5_1200 [Aliivibrio fischeri SR5]|uniref:Uncharacterized protein n=1 Tax=Aliivibrio fischeri SR5 TaxID=1088719 RepID=A0AAV3ERJ2_ALIFS|nr:hypothetical protein VFSR5_1200 [Aliivibrio fischeri SR5]
MIIKSACCAETAEKENNELAATAAATSDFRKYMGQLVINKIDRNGIRYCFYIKIIVIN